MGKLDNSGTFLLDDGEQTGACGSHSMCRILLAPILSKGRSWFSLEIECEELCELLDAKWAGGCRNTLEESVCIFPILVADLFQRTIIGLVERFR
jgi:hypothetical protein